MDDTERKERMKRLILLGKERGYLTRSEITECLEADLASQPPLPPLPKYSYPNRMIKVDAEMIDYIATTFNDMGIEIRQQKKPLPSEPIL